MDFAPRLDMVSPPRRQLGDALAAVPAEFVLYGWTAIALHLGHWQSVDSGLFGDRPLRPSGSRRPVGLRVCVGGNGAVQVQEYCTLRLLTIAAIIRGILGCIS
jgi:hypothetical protein